MPELGYPGDEEPGCPEYPFGAGYPPPCAYPDPPGPALGPVPLPDPPPPDPESKPPLPFGLPEAGETVDTPRGPCPGRPPGPAENPALPSGLYAAATSTDELPFPVPEPQAPGGCELPDG